MQYQANFTENTDAFTTSFHQFLK